MLIWYKTQKELLNKVLKNFNKTVRVRDNVNNVCIISAIKIKAFVLEDLSLIIQNICILTVVIETGDK